jgi:hypothetical protein
MRKIFICYRRADAEYAAGALGRELRVHFGEDQVFRDKEDIGGGDMWKQKVLHEIDRQSALLVLIAPRWTETRDASGARRIDDPADPIRMEVHDGIRDGATIIPVLLENASMPQAANLPTELAPLADYNALKLHDSDWQYNLQRILRTLEKAGFKPAPGRAPADSALAQGATPAASTATSAKAIVGAVLVVVTLFGLAADDLGNGAQIAVGAISLAAVVAGLLAWRETGRGVRGRVLAIAVTTLAVVTLLASLGRLDYTGKPNPVPPVNEQTDNPPDKRAKPSPADDANVLRPTPVVPQPGPPPRQTAVQLPDLNGQWDGNGYSLWFMQQGSTVQIAGMGFSFAGTGTLTGRRLLATVAKDLLLPGQLAAELSPDGRRLEGTISLTGVGTEPLLLRR